jgi:2-keto-4-pentenoate hydratase/2-oxohepta-3-ene-1,7-dioic acid hydratase in catechol pathway
MSYKELVKQSFPKIIGIGKNYINHIKEMGGSEAPKTPVIFLKPWSSLSFNPKTLSLPIAGTHRIDHEL